MREGSRAGDPQSAVTLAPPQVGGNVTRTIIAHRRDRQPDPAPRSRDRPPRGPRARGARVGPTARPRATGPPATVGPAGRSEGSDVGGGLMAGPSPVRAAARRVRVATMASSIAASAVVTTAPAAASSDVDRGGSLGTSTATRWWTAPRADHRGAGGRRRGAAPARRPARRGDDARGSGRVGSRRWPGSRPLHRPPRHRPSDHLAGDSRDQVVVGVVVHER